MSYEDREQMLDDLGYASFREAAHYEGENEDDEIKTNCHACGEELCEECEPFKCDGCDEMFCADHHILYDGEHACPDCALFWAKVEVRKMHELTDERVEARLARADAAMKAWRATAEAHEGSPLFVEKEVA